jgi:hypothetical protein
LQDEITVDIVEDIDVTDLSPEDAQVLADAEHEAKIQRLLAMRDLCQRLQDKCDADIKAKRPIEEMWLDSLRLLRGDGRYHDATKNQAVNSDSTNRPPRPKVLRSRVRRWEARMCDMLSASPWDLEADSEHGVATPEEEADQQTRASRMKETIQKQLSWCRFDRSIRNMCHDAAFIGSGLIIGPRKAERRKRRYTAPVAPVVDSWAAEGFTPAPQQVQAPTSEMVVEEYMVPEYIEGDPFFFFPDMAPTIEQCEHAHYVYMLGQLAVKNLSPGFDPLQVNALLKKDPDHGELAVNIRQRATWLDNKEFYKNQYAVKRYTGVLDKEDLAVLGLCECDDTEGDNELGSPEAPAMAMADIWYCQGFILRASLMPIPDDFRIPYLLFAPFKLDGSMFGMSLAMMGEDSDRVAASAWLATLHSASVSAGPQIVYEPGSIEPADGQSASRGPKTWKKKKTDGSIADVFGVFQIDNNVQENLQLFDRALALMDEELDTSQWAGDDMTAENTTASGLAMIFNAASILQIMVASNADDDVFEPGIDRLIWFNNDHNPDDSIKGNFIVKPLVQNERLVQDVEAQQAQVFIALGDNPRFTGMMKDLAVLKYAASFMKGPVDELVVSDEEWEESQANKPPDPAMIQLEILQAEAETQKLKAQREVIEGQTEQIRQQIEVINLQMAQNPEKDNSLALAEIALKQEALQLDRDKLEATVAMADQRNKTVRDQTAAKLNQQRIDQQEMALDRQQERQTKTMLKGMDMERDAEEIAFKRQTGKPGI